MYNIFSECPSKGCLAEKNHAIQAFLFYRTYKPFRKCVPVWCSRRASNWLHALSIQIVSEIIVYVMVAIIKKPLNLSTDLYTILQILSLTLFEKNPLEQLLANCDYKTEECDMDNQLNLSENLTGQ